MSTGRQNRRLWRAKPGNWVIKENFRNKAPRRLTPCRRWEHLLRWEAFSGLSTWRLFLATLRKMKRINFCRFLEWSVCTNLGMTLMIYPLSSFVIQVNQSSLGQESNLAPLIASLRLVLGLHIDGYAWHGELYKSQSPYWCAKFQAHPDMIFKRHVMSVQA